MTCTVTPLNASPAEVVIEQDDSTFREHLKEMGLIVAAVSAKLGVFIDTPGERCFLVDATGSVLDADAAFAVLTQLARSKRPGLVLRPASASPANSSLAELSPTRTPP